VLGGLMEEEEEEAINNFLPVKSQDLSKVFYCIGMSHFTLKFLISEK
jgi:hypothetical protein